MPRKKRGRSKEKKKAKKKPWISEKESLSFEQQIVDLNRQLARLRSRNDELETQLEDMTAKMQQLEEDRSDVVAHLKRSLEERIEEARELNEKLTALEEFRKDELAAFQKKEEAMELEYRTMESNLSAEVKLAAGKLNALEDWRLARLDLMQKFEMQEEQMDQQEQRHREALYEAEKASIIGKAKMQKEMEERLTDLAQSFREAINIRIADATHRAIRENIALNEELDAMFDICRDLEIKNKEYKDTDRMLKLESELFETEAKVVLRKTLKQRDVIKKLAEENVDMIAEYTKQKRENNYLVKQQQVLREYERKCADSEQKIRILRQHLEATEREKENVLEEVKTNCKIFENLNAILQEARSAVMESLQLEEQTAEEICNCCRVDIKDRLLRSLLNILDDSRIPTETLTYYKSPKVRGIECKYQQGDLGFLQSVPSYLEKKEEKPKIKCTGCLKKECEKQHIEGNKSADDVIHQVEDSARSSEEKISQVGSYGASAEEQISQEESVESSVLTSPKETSSESMNLRQN